MHQQRQRRFEPAGSLPEERGRRFQIGIDIGESPDRHRGFLDERHARMDDLERHVGEGVGGFLEILADAVGRERDAAVGERLVDRDGLEPKRANRSRPRARSSRTSINNS